MTVMDYTAKPLEQGRLERIAVCYLWFFLFSSVGVAAIYGAMVFGVPKFKDVFRDFNTTLPTLTQALIGLSDFLTTWLGLVIVGFVTPMIPVLPAIAAGWSDDRNSRRMVRRLLVRLYVLAMGFVIAAIVVGLMLPLVKLIQTVSGGS